jgi:hypothetical protein
MTLKRDGNCNDCGIVIPVGHGYCTECAWERDAFDSGFEHCDDFEGTCELEALEYAANIAADAFDGMCETASNDLMHYRELRSDKRLAAAHYRGLVDGLTARAELNSESAFRTLRDDAADVVSPFAESPLPHPLMIAEVIALPLLAFEALGKGTLRVIEDSLNA